MVPLDPALQRPPCQSGCRREKPRRPVPGPSGRGRSVVGGASAGRPRAAPQGKGLGGLIESLQRAGGTLLRRRAHPWIEALEQAIGTASTVCSAITGWENRWAQRNLVDQYPDGVSARAKNTLAQAEAMSPEDYRAALLERDQAQLCYTRLAPLADAVLTLSCPGPAPLWPGDTPGEPLAPRPTGNAVFNYPSSMLFAPAVTVPLMSVSGMPVGVQVMGQQHDDARVTAMARWMLDALPPVVAS
jgi:Asp-tRNA(Asn)/Glu-tRNA(Gln) amidotransferase A subunit family amidase